MIGIVIGVSGPCRIDGASDVRMSTSMQLVAQGPVSHRE